MKTKPEPRTIVVFNHHHLGDLVGSLPALLALRQRWPQARIVNVAPPAPLGLLKHSGLSDALISCPKNLRGFLNAFKQVRRERPDMAVCFSGTRRVAIMARSSGAKIRIGFSPTKHDWAWTIKVPVKGPPALQHDLRMVETLGCPAVQQDYVGLLKPSSEERQMATQWLQENGVHADEPLVGFNMGASVDRRRWGADNFAHVANELAARGARLVAFGGPQDTGLVEAFQALVKTPVMVAAGRFTPRQSAALMERCAVMVTGDTGPMHLAIAVDTPVVALFGIVPASYRLPVGYSHIGLERNEECQKLPQAKCRYINECSCLRAITPTEVVEAASSLLARRHDLVRKTEVMD